MTVLSTEHSRRYGVALVAGALLTICLWPVAGQANQGNRDRQAAETAYRRGEGLFKRGAYGDAVKAFQRSYQLFPHYLTLCNIARSQEQRGNLALARETYRRCLDDGASESEQAPQIRSALEQVESRIRARSGAARDVRLEHPAERGPGSGSTPATRPAAQPTGGDNEVAASANAVEARPVAGLAPHWFWLSGATTLALAIAATVLSAQTVKLNDDYEGDPTKARFDNVIDRRLLANVFWGLSAVSAATTTTLFVFTRFEHSRAPTGASPRLSLVVGLRGRF